MASANRGVVKSVGTAPTVGTQMVEFRRRNVRWVAWDMSGQGEGVIGVGEGTEVRFRAKSAVRCTAASIYVSAARAVQHSVEGMRDGGTKRRSERVILR